MNMTLEHSVIPLVPWELSAESVALSLSAQRFRVSGKENKDDIIQGSLNWSCVRGEFNVFVCFSTDCHFSPKPKTPPEVLVSLVNREIDEGRGVKSRQSPKRLCFLITTTCTNATICVEFYFLLCRLL